MSTQPLRSLAACWWRSPLPFWSRLRSGRTGHRGVAIFPANPKHNHASCVVETAGWQPAGGLVRRQRRT